MTNGNGPGSVQAPQGGANGQQTAIDAAMVAVAFLMASGAVYAVARQLPMPDWYVLILGNIVAFYFGRRTR